MLQRVVVIVLPFALFVECIFFRNCYTVLYFDVLLMVENVAKT